MITKIKAFLKAAIKTVKIHKQPILYLGVALGLACMNGLKMVVY